MKHLIVVNSPDSSWTGQMLDKLDIEYMHRLAEAIKNAVGVAGASLYLATSTDPKSEKCAAILAEELGVAEVTNDHGLHWGTHGGYGLFGEIGYRKVMELVDRHAPSVDTVVLLTNQRAADDFAVRFRATGFDLPNRVLPLYRNQGIDGFTLREAEGVDFNLETKVAKYIGTPIPSTCEARLAPDVRQ